MLKIERNKANKTLLTCTIFQKMLGETRELILKNVRGNSGTLKINVLIIFMIGSKFVVHIYNHYIIPTESFLSTKLKSQYRYWLSFSDIGLVFFIIGRVYDFIIPIRR
jgi:hypothetical protein